jgi:hypothetical protein
MMAGAVLACGLLVGAAQAQPMTDPADLTFWQSIQNSTNPDEFVAYLQAFPNGRFAALARLRAGQGAAPPPASGPAAAPAATPGPVADDTANDYKITITPAAGRVGQQFTPSCGTVPFGTTYDQLVIVPAGTPVTQPGTATETSRVLWMSYTPQCTNLAKAGPFAPGAYELRWMTSLFNNDSPKRYELKAKAPFTVR